MTKFCVFILCETRLFGEASSWIFFFLIFNFYSGLRADLAQKRKKEKDMSAILCVTWKQKLIEGWEMLTKPNFIV